MKRALQGGEGNPLASFPMLSIKPEDDLAFMNPDYDGVYRAYLVDGTVIDAARLSNVQIETYLSVMEDSGELSEERVAAERAAFASTDNAAVPEIELLNPPESVKPLAKLAMVQEEINRSPIDVGPLERRQRGPLPVIQPCPIPGFYCLATPQTCIRQNPNRCRCNGVYCQTRYT